MEGGEGGLIDGWCIELGMMRDDLSRTLVV